MTAPTDERPIEAPPEQAWEPAPEPAQHRSEPADDGDRGRPVGQWVLAGGSAATLGSVGLFSAFGPVGLAAGAVVAAGGGIAYGVYRVRRGKRPGFKATRMRTRSARSTSRLGSVGKGGRGKGPKLLGGKGAKLGKGGKLGGSKSGKLLGGKGAKLGGGRSGKLFGGGRGSKLGGKAGLGLGKGRKGATSRLGSVGSGARRSGKLLGRGGKAGLVLGKRGGKLLGGKSKTGFARWGKSTGGGAKNLGRGLGKAARKTGRGAAHLAGKTKAGRQAAHGFRAARSALTSASPGRGRWRAARQAARSKLGTQKNVFDAWGASLAAAFLAFAAMAHGRWKKRQAKKQTAAGGTQTTPTTTAAGTTTTTTTTTRAIGPGVINPTRIHQKRRTMSAFPLAAGAAEMGAAAASHAPQSMLQVANELDQFGEVPTQVALAVRSYTMRLESDYPIHPAVVEKLQEYAIAEAHLKAIADEIGPLFRQVHAKDLERFEAPRTNEQAWDVNSV